MIADVLGLPTGLFTLLVVFTYVVLLEAVSVALRWASRRAAREEAERELRRIDKRLGR